MLTKPIKALTVTVSSVLVFTASVSVMQAQNHTIKYSATEDIEKVSLGKEGGTACNKLEKIDSPVRSGQWGFKHWVNRCGKRSELEMRYNTTIGETYWMGWSMYLPTSWQNSSDSSDIVAQWPAYPPSPKRQFKEQGCGAVGSKMTIKDDDLRFDFQHQGDTQDTQCDKYPLGNINEMKGKWVDFVMHAKWTGDSDGFLKLWMKVGNGAYVQKIDYTGRTFWNDEKWGPYFKMGLYKSAANWDGPGAPRFLYTDEYRLGGENSNFATVAPPVNQAIVPDEEVVRPEIRVEAEQIFLSSYEIESNKAASNDATISLKNATDTTGTASTTFAGAAGKYDVLIGYFDEDDGVGSLQVSIANALVDAWQLDQDLGGSGGAVSRTFVRKQIASGMYINKGARIEIKGTHERSEEARVDYIDFVPAP